MSRFSNEVRIIPAVAWIIGVAVAVTMFSCLYFVAIPHDHKLSQWPVVAQIGFALLGLLPMAAILLVGYINADARRRGMRYVMWTLLALFLPNSLGIILYFILREPLLAQCAKCGAQGRANFTFCPQCGAGLTTACPGCKRPVEVGWSRCAYCGIALVSGPTTQGLPSASQ
jgi:hypothetical protein